jgi:hypothetical protein
MEPCGFFETYAEEFLPEYAHKKRKTSDDGK